MRKTTKNTQNGKPRQNNRDSMSTTVKSNNDGTVTVIIRQHRDRNGGHPHVMTGKVDKKLVSVGITHDNKKGKGHSNRPLKINPTGENKQAYLKKQATIDRPQNYSTKTTKGKMHSDDYAFAQEVSKRAIKKSKQSRQKTKK